VRYAAAHDPFQGDLLERRTSFELLTARDTAHCETLSCSVFLKYGDFVNGDQLFVPPEEARRQVEPGEQVRCQLLLHLQASLNIHVLDATYQVHPDVYMRFAVFILDSDPAASTP
jgi:hypothetical protein